MTGDARALTINVASVAAERPPLTRFVITYVLAISSLAACGYFWGATGFDLLIVGMGWPHVILGFIFYANKIVRNEGSHRKVFYWLLGITIAIGFAHSLRNITTLIYLYFIFHAFRDEIFIYRQRSTGHRFGGRVFDRSGLALLAGVVLLTLVGQLQWWPAVRSVQIPLSDLRRGDDRLISFPAIENSRGRDYFVSLTAPRSYPGIAFKGYVTDNTYRDGCLILGDAKISGDDAVFRLSYRDSNPDAATENIARASGPASGSEGVVANTESRILNMTTIDWRVLRAHQIVGGQRFGQTFRAEADNLNGIFLAIEPPADSFSETKLTMRLEPAIAALYPYAYQAGFCVAFLVLTLLAMFRVPRGVFTGLPGLSYAMGALFLVVAAMTAMKITRYYELPSPLFFGFLVVFHYFSWYVFYFEKLKSRRAPATSSPIGSSFEGLLKIISTRNGFLAAIIVMNVVSFGGAYAYYLPRLGGGMRYAFDLKYFLYFLVFHVTMSFAPKRREASLTRI